MPGRAGSSSGHFVGQVQMMQSDSAQQIIEKVQRAFGEEPRLGPEFELERIEMAGDGVIVLEGDVARLSHKKLVLLRAAAVPGVTDLIDRVHLSASPPKRGRHIRDRIAELLAHNANFSGFEVREDVAGGVLATDFQPVTGDTGSPLGRIDIEVNDDIVTLNGSVPSLVHKRLAGAMAWWAPGARDVE